MPPWRALIGDRNFVLGGAIVIVLSVTAIVPQLFTALDPYGIHVSIAMRGPTQDHLFGTDSFGRDVLTRIIYGTRNSLGIAIASIAIAVVVGGPLGLVAGYFGRWVDQVAGRAADLVYSFPSLVLAVVLAGVLGASVQNAIIAIAIVNGPVFFRVARAPALALREREYVLAARAVGAAAPRILITHLGPNVLTPVVVQASVALSFAILIEASLSFLGLGVQPPHPSWGSILNEGRPFLQIAPWVSVFPGVVIMLCVLAFNLMGDGLRDVLDPRGAI